jgi:hypothetical protein
MQSKQANVNLNSTDLSQILQDFTVKEWIAKDSYLPVKQQIGVNLNTSAIQTTGTADSIQMNINMNATLTYSDYGNPVTTGSGECHCINNNSLAALFLHHADNSILSKILRHHFS